MVEITNLSTYWLNTPESIAARHIEDIARDYFARHDDVSGFLLIVPSIYTFDQIRNDIDIAIFGGFHGLTLQDDYHIDSFAMIVEVKSHPIEYVSVDAGHHYLVTYSDGMKDVTRQALSEALSLKKHLNGSGIEGSADFSGGRRGCQEYSVASLNIKNLMSPTPRNWVLNAFILALKDSAEALVSLRSK